MNLVDNVKLIKKENESANCIGTALFLTNLIEEDRLAYDCEVWRHIDPYDYKTTPTNKYCIAIWFNKNVFHYDRYERTDINRIEHMGVVTNLEPILITNRTNFLGPLIENQPIENIIPNLYDVNYADYTYIRYFSLKSPTK